MEGNTSTLIVVNCASSCAQRLSASWKETLANEIKLQVEANVLNAFRHHGRKHDFASDPRRQAFLCSTPFGIMEGNTAMLVDEDMEWDACSTPFGIMEGNTTTHKTCEIV